MARVRGWDRGGWFFSGRRRCPMAAVPSGAARRAQPAFRVQQEHARGHDPFALLQAGADLVTFSGDKLLGGPQAGIIVGRKALIAQLRRHPMARALRVDKLTFAALDATLRSYQRGRAVEELPVWQMISATVASLTERVQQWIRQLDTAQVCGKLIAGESAIGGGSLPGEVLPTVLLAVNHPAPDAVAAQLRRQNPPVVCRIQHDHLLFDPRTVLPDQEPDLLRGLLNVIA